MSRFGISDPVRRTIKNQKEEIRLLEAEREFDRRFTSIFPEAVISILLLYVLMIIGICACAGGELILTNHPSLLLQVLIVTAIAVICMLQMIIPGYVAVKFIFVFCGMGFGLMDKAMEEITPLSYKKSITINTILEECFI